MALGDVIARLSVHLGLETAAFEKGSKRAENRMSGFQKNMQRTSNAVKTAFVGMLGVFAVDQLVSVARAGLEYASSLGEVASQLGVTTKALQEYRFAASQAGIEQGEMDLALAQLTRRLGDAANGAKEPAKALAALGISARDATGNVRDAGDVIPLIAEGLKSIESPAERASILVDLFGKSGQKLAPLLEGGAAGVNNLRNAAHELGIVLDDGVIQDADDAADKLAAMKQVMEAKIAGFVASNIKEITALADQLFRVASAAIKAADALAKWVSGSGPGGKQAAFQNMRIKDPGTTDSLFNIRPATNVPTTTRSTGYIDAFGNPYTKRRQIRLPKGGRGGGGGANAVGANAFGGGFGNFDPGQGASGWMRMAAAANDMAKPVATIDTLMTRMALQTGVRMVANFRDAAMDADQIARSAQNIIDRLFPDEARTRQYIDDLAILRLQYGGTAENAAKLAEAEKRLRDEWIMSTPAVEALSKGFGKYMDAANDAAETSEVQSVRISQTFADMAQSVISSLNQLSSQLGGGKFFSILSAVAGLGIGLGQAGVFGSGFQAKLNKIPGRAIGGPISAGRPYMVGERGPELVVPRNNGHVIPNNALGGGSTVTIVPTPYFDAVVDGRADRRVAMGAPGIATAAASGVQSNIRQSQARSLP